MSISVTEKQNQNGFNPLKYAAYGAGAGVVARSLLPISKEEQARFSQLEAERSSVVKSKVDAILAELREQAKSAPLEEQPAYDMYFRFSDSNLKKTERPKIEQKAAALPEAARVKFFEMKNHVDSVVSNTKKAHDFIARAVIKESRSLFNFTAVGAALFVGGAFVNHVLSKMAESDTNTGFVTNA